MPKGTRVERLYKKLKNKMGESSAAAISQSSTKQSLKTGKPLKKKSKSWTEAKSAVKKKYEKT